MSSFLQSRFLFRAVLLVSALFLTVRTLPAAPDQPAPAPVAAAPADFRDTLQPGDLVFIHVGGPLFSRVACASNGWVSHVGIIVGRRDGRWMVGEGTVPQSRVTPLDSFLKRSSNGQFAIKRLRTGMTPAQVARLNAAVEHRLRKFYDFGFDLDSTRTTFCSKFVYQVVNESTGQQVGEVATFRTLLAENPSTPMWFWRIWYFGRVPWDRKTVTPESQFESPLLATVAEHA